MRFCSSGRDRSKAFATSGTWQAKFFHVLITGFDGAHWAEWFLLRTAVELAENATTVLEEPRNFSDVDLCWIGSWEEVCGRSPRAERPPRSAIRFSAKWKCAEARKQSFDFLIGTNFRNKPKRSRGNAFVISQMRNARLGVIFPGGALPRLVASSLSGLKCA
jgi:lipocalin